MLNDDEVFYYAPTETPLMPVTLYLYVFPFDKVSQFNNQQNTKQNTNYDLQDTKYCMI